MKIRYSDKVKHLLSPDDIMELVQLSYSFIPFPKKQIFSFCILPDGKTKITHQAINTNMVKKIIVDRMITVKETVTLFRSADTIYILMEGEE